MKIEAFTKSISKALSGFAVACTMAAMSPSTGQAATLDFNFSFASVTGTITGLTDDSKSYASSVTLTWNGNTYDLGRRDFTVLGGKIIAASHYADDNGRYTNIADSVSGKTARLDIYANRAPPPPPPPPPPLPGGIAIAPPPPADPGLFMVFYYYDTISGLPDVWDAEGNATFTQVTPVSPVPLPAGGLLLLSGLAGIAVFRRRKKSTA